ncbi:hypothetical protein BJ878DRAFT_489793 [Calycina marina]|uniref:Ribosomal protein bL31m N-terminal domain-containing protein n=1 Tax=Calycina marina TaxID=1763456 RepID=A0A9P8CI76_9HELO|nr:hypothetical protein BJ878DRAFT_489793 [Calycina marina]
MSQLPFLALRRTPLPSIQISQTQKRHASLIKRPHRPYTFTQLVTLSDGSSYLTRTTSPLPVYKSTKDTRNTVLWQPSLASLRNVEQDEAGRLRAFRARFGRGWDMESAKGEEDSEGESTGAGDLMDLISGKGAKGPAAAGGAKREVVAEETRVDGDNEIKMVVVKIDGKLVKVPYRNQEEKEKK